MPTSPLWTVPNIFFSFLAHHQPVMQSTVQTSMPPIVQGNVYAKSAGCNVNSTYSSSQMSSIKAFPLQPQLLSSEDMVQIRRTSTGSIVSFQTDISISSLGKSSLPESSPTDSMPRVVPPVNNPQFELPSIVEERESPEPSSGSVISFRTNIPGKQILTHVARMLGTFNQHLPLILSNNYWCQSKPTSLPDTSMGVVPWVNK